jgi:tripartite-type tricarboxylate transporter receptor subunit TctC
VESGFPPVGYNPDVWLGLLAPAGTAVAVVERLDAVVNDSLKPPEMKAALTKLGFEPKSATPQQFATFLAAEMQKWPLLAAAGVKARVVASVLGGWGARRFRHLAPERAGA